MSLGGFPKSSSVEIANVIYPSIISPTIVPDRIHGSWNFLVSRPVKPVQLVSGWQIEYHWKIWGSNHKGLNNSEDIPTILNFNKGRILGKFWYEFSLICITQQLRVSYPRGVPNLPFAFVMFYPYHTTSSTRPIDLVTQINTWRAFMLRGQKKVRFNR